MSIVMKLANYKAVLMLLAVAIFGMLLSPAMVGAQGAGGTLDCPSDDPFCLDKAQPTKLGDKDLMQTVTDLINVALGLLGIVAVVIILIGGFKWMTAGGSEDKVGEARKLIFSGIIGLAIILSAFAIASFVLNNLQDATGAGEDFTG